MTKSEPDICDFVAKKAEPETWGGDDPDEWNLGDQRKLGWLSDSWTCPHEALEGHNKCIFHIKSCDVPDDKNRAAELVQILKDTQNIDDKTERQKKHQFIGAKFGDVNISLSDVSETLRFDHTKFEGNVNITGDINSVWFHNADFKGETIWKEVNFLTDPIFDSVEFEDLTVFSGVQFSAGASFDNARFHKPVNFNKTVYNGGDSELATITSFQNTRFLFGATFNNASFFNGARFNNAKFSFNTSFDNTTLNCAEFKNTVFEKNVSFAGSKFTGFINFDEAKFMGEANFRMASFTSCHATEQDFSEFILDRADFTDSVLSDSSFQEATLHGTKFSRAVLNGVDFRDAQIYGALFGEAKIDERTNFGQNDKNNSFRVASDPEDGSHNQASYVKLSLLRYIRPNKVININNIPENENLNSDTAQRAAVCYHLIEKLAKENTLPGLQSSAFVRRQDMHRIRYYQDKSMRSIGKWIRASTARMTLLYGESPWRILVASLATIIVCGALYPLGGIAYANSNETIRADSIQEWLSLLPDGIYFSTLTFTTLGFGSFQPVGWGRWLATMETAFGATLLALLVFVLGRRAAR